MVQADLEGEADETMLMSVRILNLGTQILYQIVVLGSFCLEGDTILHTNHRGQKQTFIFNTWVLLQAFCYTNEDHQDDDDGNKNKNSISLRIRLVALTLLMLVFVNVVAGMNCLRWQQWAVCFAIAAMSWPISWLFSQLHKNSTFSLDDGGNKFGAAA